MAAVAGGIAASIALSGAGLPPNVDVSYQLGGAYAPEPNVGVVVRDSTDSPAPGAYNICYLNGFQTQPGTLSWWKKHHNGLLLRKKSKLVRDGQWNEVLLDTSTKRKRKQIARVQGAGVRGCAAKGFDAAEFDNLDSNTRSKGQISLANNAATAKKLVKRAHRAGLAAAQKNTVELGKRGPQRIGFDFVIAEECQRYSECGRYQKWYGNRMIEVEYTDYSLGTFETACEQRGEQISIIRRDRELRTPNSPAYYHRSC